MIYWPDGFYVVSRHGSRRQSSRLLNKRMQMFNKWITAGRGAVALGGGRRELCRALRHPPPTNPVPKLTSIPHD